MPSAPSVSSSSCGDPGLDTGADFKTLLDSWRRGRGVSHNSHDRSEGWLRNVHAGHAIGSFDDPVLFGIGGARVERPANPGDGSDEDK